MLFRSSGITWDEGVGYDYQPFGGRFEPEFDESYGTRPSNWYSATTLTPWTYEGIYDNNNNASFTVVNSQNFDQGNATFPFVMLYRLASVIPLYKYKPLQQISLYLIFFQ